MERRLFIKKVMGWCGAILALLFGCKAHAKGRHQLSYKKAFEPVNPAIGVAIRLVPSLDLEPLRYSYLKSKAYKWDPHGNHGTVTWIDDE